MSSFGSTGLGLAKVGSRASRSLDTATAALISRMTTPPSAARTVLIDQLIRSLKSAGVWTKLDVLYLTAAADSQAARLNWLSSSYTLSTVSSPTFTADRGYAGDGSASYLDTGFQPAVSGGSIALQNDNHLGIYVNTAVSSTGIDCGSQNHTINTNNSGNISARNFATTSDTVSAGGTSIGHTIHSRGASGSYSRYKAGSSLGDATRASTTPNAESIFLGARSVFGAASAFSTRRIAAIHAGGSLTSGQALAFYNALNTYLTAIGAN